MSLSVHSLVAAVTVAVNEVNIHQESAKEISQVVESDLVGGKPNKMS